MPFYPSYYPQEITVETMAPAAAAAGLAKNTLHAYVGGDPYAGKPLPEGVTAFESLASYVVVTLDAAAPAFRSAEARCAAARAIAGTLRGEGWVYHPYPVTPWHPDYLRHADLAEAAGKAAPRTASGPLPRGLRLRARGRLAQRLVPASGSSASGAAVTVEEVPIADLVAASRSTLHGGMAPPWVKAGWFHAWRLLGAHVEPAARPEVEALVARLEAGGQGAVERINLERRVVHQLLAGCRRVVAGFTLRREVVNDDYSAGVENVAADSLLGLNSPIFLRTVKLKDFPWNGWLTVGIPEPPRAAWNPVAGFSDAAGRLLWAGLADPALFPAPGGSWVENRVRLATPEMETGTLAVPPEAVAPEPGTGRLVPVGEGRTAGARLTYRVLTSAYHDGSRMTAADALYALAFGLRWGSNGPDRDAAVARVTERWRQWLVALRVLRVDTDVLRFGDVTMKYEVPVIEAYLARALPDPYALAAIAPPWMPVPWPLLALLEEGVRRGIGAFSAEEAQRRGVPWLDVVRDRRQREQLERLLGELERQAFVPPALAGLVTAEAARARWARLAQFAAEHGHLLVTSGPYLLHAWSPRGAVLRVFRDFSYPLGVGSFDRYPLPLRGFVAEVMVRPDRLEVRAEAQRVERFGRERRLVTEPVGSPAAQKDRGAHAVCHWMAVGPDGQVVAAATTEPTERGTFEVPREGLPRGGTVVLAVVVNDYRVNVQTRSVPVP